jgi:RHS repeat-associated protein
VNGVVSNAAGHLPKRALGYGTAKGSEIVGQKRYELSNHLNNVLEVISDRKWAMDNGVYNLTTGAQTSTTPDGIADYYLPVIVAYTDYDPYGTAQTGRKGGDPTYRFGFQGQEMDDEIKGEGNSVNYEYRMHDPRLGRFFAVDPLAAKYAHNSPYAFSENRVIDGVELEGLEFSKRMDWNQVNTSMYQLKDSPESINQGGAGTCVLAAVTYLWILHDFKSFHDAVVGLYFKGEAQINNFIIKPEKAVFYVHPDNSRSSMNYPFDIEDAYKRELDADWMILTSLQNTLVPEEHFYGYGADKNGTPADDPRNAHDDASNILMEIGPKLMTDLLGYNDVQENFYYKEEERNSMNPFEVMSNLEGLSKQGYDIIISSKMGLLRPGRSGGHAFAYIPDSYYTTESGGVTYINFEIQNWGATEVISVTEDVFRENYNGAVWGRKTDTN